VVRAPIVEHGERPEPDVSDGADEPAIAGKVLTSDGRPGAGAAVAAYSPQTAAIRSIAGKDGSFRIGGLRPGTYRLSASLKKYNDAVLTDIAAGSSGHTLILNPLSVVEGRVLCAETGEPVVQFDVFYLKVVPDDDRYWRNIIYSQSTQWTHVANADGRYRLEGIVSDTQFAVAARAPGFEPAFVEVPATEASKTATAPDIVLHPEACISGRVLSPENDPVAGAQVYIGETPHGRHVVESKMTGEYAIRQLPEGPITLTATHRDHLPASVEATVSRGQTTHLDIVLSGGGWVEGTVYEGETPLSGQPVMARALHEVQAVKTVQTDESGYYSIRGLPSGSTEIVVERQPDEPYGLPIRLTKKAVIEEGLVTDVDFQIKDASASIKGLVTVAGVPAPQARITGTVTGAGSDSAFGTYSDANGQWTVENLPPGEAWIQIAAIVSDDREQTKNLPLDIVAGQEHPLNVDFGGTSSIYGTVTGLTDNEVADIRILSGTVDVDMTSVEKALEVANITVATCNPNPDGTYRIVSIPEGTYTVLITAFDADTNDNLLDHIRADSVGVSLQSGESKQVNLAVH